MKKRDRKITYDKLNDPWYDQDKKFIETCNTIFELYGKKDKKNKLKVVK